MRKEQYDGIINNVLNDMPSVICKSDFQIVKNILNKMGIPLPTGDLQNVFSIVHSNCYMGWRLCTLKKAFSFANKGIAAIGLNKERIVILKGSDEQEQNASNTAVLTFEKLTNVSLVSDLFFYGYITTRTAGNQYSNYSWSSLEDAMDYYGNDFTYTYCGGYYNYYYSFSDGSRMYFHVG